MWGNSHSTTAVHWIRLVFDYSAPLQTTASTTNLEKIDRLQNQALRFVCGGLTTTPTCACEIDVNVEPLKIRRERATVLTLERFKRMEGNNPCKRMTDTWQNKNRVQKTSFLKEVTKLSENYRLPNTREMTASIPGQPPHQGIR